MNCIDVWFKSRCGKWAVPGGESYGQPCQYSQHHTNCMGVRSKSRYGRYGNLPQTPAARTRTASCRSSQAWRRRPAHTIHIQCIYNTNTMQIQCKNKMWRKPQYSGFGACFGDSSKRGALKENGVGWPDVRDTRPI